MQRESTQELRQRIAVLEERLSALHAAVMRVSASLDLETVLQEVVDSARALTGARYGVITTQTAAGRIEDFVTSGFTPEERAEMAAWSDGPRLFAHFRDLRAPLRLANLPTYVRELGFSSDLMRSQTLQCTPLLHRDVYLGSFFLAEKEPALSSRRATKRFWSCSLPRRRQPSPTHTPTATSSAQGQTWRPSSRRRRWVSSSSTARPASPSRSTGRPAHRRAPAYTGRFPWKSCWTT